MNDLHHGDVVRAIRQTDGRGRFQRTWVSPQDQCLTFTVMLEPAQDEWLIGAVTRIAALGVCAALEGNGLSPQVKWPNDVLLGERKVAGILAERAGDQGLIVLGIGLNVNMQSEGIRNAGSTRHATSMAVESGRQYDIDALCGDVLAKLQQVLDRASDAREVFLVSAWLQRDALNKRALVVTTHNGSVSGQYLGLTPDGELCLRDAQGTEHRFSAGDVSVGKLL